MLIIILAIALLLTGAAIFAWNLLLYVTSAANATGSYELGRKRMRRQLLLAFLCWIGGILLLVL